jgi:hypothetical protein
MGEGTKFEIALGSRVYVTAIMMETDGMQYRIVYWAEGIRHVDWVYGFELGHAVTV